MDNDWDLHAIVRGCSSMKNNPIPNATNNYDSFSIPPSLPYNENSFETFPGHFDQKNENSFETFPGQFDQKNQNSLDDFSGLFDDEQNDPFCGLQEIYQVFCVDPLPETENTTTVGATQVAQVFQPNELIAQVQPLPQMNADMSDQENVPLDDTNSLTPLSYPGASLQPVIRQRRRKNQQTRLIKEMTQEQLAADSWAWRKYGQKPIKGSPYPRNYYRCSTSKGCAARKQVERSLTNPEIFVVSYTNEHTHPRPIYRNSLTGATRYRPNPALGSGSTSGQNKTNTTTTTNIRKTISRRLGSRSSPGSGSGLSPDTPTKEIETTKQNDDVEMTENISAAYDNEEENIMMINDLMMNDDEDIFTFKDSDESSGDLFAAAAAAASAALMSPPWTPTNYIAAATMTMFGDDGGDGVV